MYRDLSIARVIRKSAPLHFSEPQAGGGINEAAMRLTKLLLNTGSLYQFYWGSTGLIFLYILK